MSCFRPIPAERNVAGAVFLNRPARGVERDGFAVPCGICMGCRLDHARSWAVRCVHEAACWDSSLFVTLTYDEDSLPRYGSLDKSHLQLFMKRLRKSVRGDRPAPDDDSRFPIRYFACGEYGATSSRAHYHLLLFNVAVSDLVRSGKDTFRSDLFSRVWRYGAHEIGRVSPDSASYVAGYSVKKVRRRYATQDELDRIYGVVDMETGELVMREPEFCVSSRRPGVGAYWLDEFSSDLKRGFVMHGGRETPVPRYYRKRLAASQPQFSEEVAYRAFLRANGIPLEERSEERLQVREEVAVRKFHSRSRGGVV